MEKYKYKYLRIKLNYQKQKIHSRRIQNYILILWSESLKIGKLKVNIKYPMLVSNYEKTFHLRDRLERVYC